jgi:DNA-binding MarR family transcriptional regulator
MSTNRTLRAVPTTETDTAKPRTETEEKLWKALQDAPGSTATALSAVAAIGKSTASKILARWGKDGLVNRAVGIADGGSRPADRWSISTTDDQLIDEPTNEEPTGDAPTNGQLTEEQSTEDQPTAAGGRQEKAQRLAPGALRGMVEDYLRNNPGEFSPNAIGKALSRSSGAVHNALEKLVASGYATRTSDKPKKYSLAAASVE